jgi:hypothetical protein
LSRRQRGQAEKKKEKIVERKSLNSALRQKKTFHQASPHLFDNFWETSSIYL